MEQAGEYPERPEPRLIASPEIAIAADVFGVGFSRTCALFGPYQVVTVGPLRVMRDEPRRPRDARLAEVLAYGIDPQAVVDAIKRYGIGRHGVCAIHGLDQDPLRVRDAYRALGYRLVRREPFFWRDLSPSDPTEVDPRVRRVTHQDDARELAVFARRRQLDEGHIVDGDSDIRLYGAWQEGVPVGRVRSVDGGHGCRWVADLFVDPEVRGQGVGRALMNAMLADDARYGYRASVLVASSAGTRLYPKVGYRQIGLLQLLLPNPTSEDEGR